MFSVVYVKLPLHSGRESGSVYHGQVTGYAKPNAKSFFFMLAGDDSNAFCHDLVSVKYPASNGRWV